MVFAKIKFHKNFPVYITNAMGSRVVAMGSQVVSFIILPMQSIANS